MKNYKKINTSIIIPSFNESSNLSILLPKLHLEVKIKNLEIIVIDGYYFDKKTYDLCKKNKAIYCKRSINNSYGEAIRSGIKKAKGKYIVVMDADFSHTPSFINKMYSLKGSDVVIASRYISKGGTENSSYLIYLSRALNYIYSKILSIPIKDISNSFRLYNASKIKNINTICNNFDIVEEIIFKLYKKYKNLNVIEIPYFFKRRKFGSSKRTLIFSISYLITLIRLRLFN
jgi:dolichol-phosphate mannosyltransferase